MQNLKPRSRSRDLEYVHYSADVGKDLVKVALWHGKGGINWAHGSRSESGIYLAFTPEVERTADGHEIIPLLSGIRALVLPQARVAPKRMEQIAEILDPYVPMLSETYGRVARALRAEAKAMHRNHLGDLTPAQFPELQQVLDATAGARAALLAGGRK